TNMLAVGDRLLALYEGGKPYALDLHTLKTVGETDFAGTLPKGSMFAAHPKSDASGTYNFGAQFGPFPKLNFFKVQDNGTLDVLHSVPMKDVVSPHDF